MQFKDTIAIDQLFPLKMSLLLSLFWKNIGNIQYFIQRDLNVRSNVEIKISEHIVNVSRPMHICIIHEDEELMNDILKGSLNAIEDVFYFPNDSDE